MQMCLKMSFRFRLIHHNVQFLHRELLKVLLLFPLPPRKSQFELLFPLPSRKSQVLKRAHYSSIVSTVVICCLSDILLFVLWICLFYECFMFVLWICFVNFRTAEGAKASTVDGSSTSRGRYEVYVFQLPLLRFQAHGKKVGLSCLGTHRSGDTQWVDLNKALRYESCVFGTSVECLL